MFLIIINDISISWPWQPGHQGPPGGYNNEYHGYIIYDNKLWMAIEADVNAGFFANASHIEQGNQRWIGWYGSLTQGELNFACITSNTQNAMVCDSKTCI